MSFVEALVDVPLPRRFAFSPSGAHVARLVDRAGALAVEVRKLAGRPSAEHVSVPDRALSDDALLYFHSENRLLIRCRLDGGYQILEARRTGQRGGPPRTPGPRGGQPHTSGRGSSAWTADALATFDVPGMWLLPPIPDAPWDALVALGADLVSTIWRLDHDSRRVRPLARIPGIVSSGDWIEPGRVLAVDLRDRGPASGFLIDLVSGTYQRLFHLSDESSDRVALVDRRRGLLAVTSDCFGHRRAGVAQLRGTRRVRFFPDPQAEERSLDICALAPDGRQLVLRRHRGVRTELWLADPDRLVVRGPLPVPHGVVTDPVISTGNALRFPFTTAALPPTCASYLPRGAERSGLARKGPQARAGGQLQDRDRMSRCHDGGARDLTKGSFRLAEATDLGNLAPGDLSSARIVSFPGPRGEIEALALEPPRGRGRDLVVLAAHGGPVDQWSAAFTPELQLLAGLGATVVAPNYHGSTGYGPAFIRALEGRAGTVDLDDLLAVADATSWGPRWPLVAYGESYGAFLALKLAAFRPDLIRGVIAVAPFASLASLRAVAHPPVRQLVDLLGGPSLGHDTADLLRHGPAPGCPLLLAHGSQDHTIPVEQSRVLADALRAQGYVDGRDLWLLELPGEDHVLSGREARRRLYNSIASFLSFIAPTPRGLDQLASRDVQDTVWQVGGLAHAPEPAAPLTSL